MSAPAVLRGWTGTVTVMLGERVGIVKMVPMLPGCGIIVTRVVLVIRKSI